MHYMGLANHSTYAATKAALRSYPRTWAAEFKDSGLRANTLSPGVVDTPMRRPGRAGAVAENHAGPLRPHVCP
jgi:NAD(P)-dependent dehydrogenase (short-subunit alcohol dehydrogenase family)